MRIDSIKCLSSYANKSKYYKQRHKTMKILLVSDSHSDLLTLQQVIDENKDADLILHAGDYITDIRKVDTHKIPFYAVMGNCDAYSSSWGNEEEYLRVGNLNTILLHGHKHLVKTSYEFIKSTFYNMNVELVVFGHTHIPVIFSEGKTLFVNPGSCSKTKARSYPSYAIVTTDDKGDYSAKIVEIL